MKSFAEQSTLVQVSAILMAMAAAAAVIIYSMAKVVMDGRKALKMDKDTYMVEYGRSARGKGVVRRTFYSYAEAHAFAVDHKPALVRYNCGCVRCPVDVLEVK